MNKQITVTVNGKPRLAVADMTLSEIINGEKPCGGHGKCGKCKVVTDGALSELTEVEKKLLNDDELEKGVRLACLTYALGDCNIRTLSENERSQIVTDGALPEFEIKPTFAKYGIAIDIGTTTLAARLYNTEGKLLAKALASIPSKNGERTLYPVLRRLLTARRKSLRKR